MTCWATWCPYCLMEMPVLNNIQPEIGKERMQVIAVNVEDRDVFRKASGALSGLDLVLAYDPDNAGRNGFGVGPIPHMVIGGPDGRSLPSTGATAKTHWSPSPPA